MHDLALLPGTRVFVTVPEVSDSAYQAALDLEPHNSSPHTLVEHLEALESGYGTVLAQSYQGEYPFTEKPVVFVRVDGYPLYNSPIDFHNFSPEQCRALKKGES